MNTKVFSVRSQKERDIQLKSDPKTAQKGHLCFIIKMQDLYGFIKNLEKIIYDIGLKINQMRNNNDSAKFRANAGAGAVVNDCKIEIRDITWCVGCVNLCNDNRTIVKTD